MSGRGPRIFAASAGILVVAVMALGLVANGWPSDVRTHRLDQQRLRDLGALSNAIDQYRRSVGTLPASISAVIARNPWLPIRDPETGLAYEFSVKDAAVYELCANFGAQSTEADEIPTPGTFVYSQSIAQADHDGSQGPWEHSAGRQCFSFDLGSAPKTQ